MPWIDHRIPGKEVLDTIKIKINKVRDVLTGGRLYDARTQKDLVQALGEFEVAASYGVVLQLVEAVERARPVIDAARDLSVMLNDAHKYNPEELVNRIQAATARLVREVGRHDAHSGVQWEDPKPVELYAQEGTVEP